ncbi:MAG TPA: MinD/ParA family protein [Firmicutes bacterium]|nr:MinD/ParA family protein [Bacillota bacterium]
MPDQAEHLRQLVREWGKRQASRRSRTIAITSGKGGVGKTNFTVNLGLALREQGRTVTIFDADLGLANVDIILGIAPPYTLAHVARGERTFAEVAYETHNLKVVAGGSGIEELAELPAAELTRLVQEAAQLNSDFFLIDTGAGISRHVISMALAAQEVVVVTTPEPPALTDAYALIKVLARRSPALTLHLVVNRVQSLSEGERVAQSFQRVVAEFLDTRVNHLGSIPEDGAVRLSVSRQEPLLCSHPEAVAALQVRRIAARLTGAAVPPGADGLRGFLGRLHLFFR